jgi:hypothetical protein
MPKKNGNENENSDKGTNNYSIPENMKMVNLAVNGVSLLREDLIDDFRKALYPPTGSLAEFKKVCDRAGIDPKVAADLYKGLTKGFAPTGRDVWV